MRRHIHVHANTWTRYLQQKSLNHDYKESIFITSREATSGCVINYIQVITICRQYHETHNGTL
jgi:hypothetical protein